MSNLDPPGPTLDPNTGSRPRPPGPPPIRVQGYGSTKGQDPQTTWTPTWTQHDHHWVRIGPYLKCTRCGDLKAATTGKNPRTKGAT